MKKQLCVILSVCVLLGTLFSACAVQDVAPTDSDPTPATPSSTHKDLPNDTNFDPDNMETWFSDEQAFPSADKIDTITVGMTLTEVVHILGLPKRDIGSGKFILEWELKAENNLVIVFERESTDINLSLGDSIKVEKIATDGSIKGIYS